MESILMRVVSTASMLLAIAGCAAPAFHQPEVPTPSAFKESADAADAAANVGAGGEARWKPAEPSEALARGQWWTAFDDPALDALEAEAVIANADVAAAAARVRQARALLRGAEADRYPQVDAVGGASRGRVARRRTTASA